MFGYQINGYTMGELEQRVVPRGMRAVPKPLYDTQLYTQGTTETLTFFTQAQAQGRFITNMEQAGQIPNPEFFIAEYATLDVLGLEPGDTDNLRDMHRILFGDGSGGGPYAVLRYNSQEWGPWPLSGMAASGGPTGFTTRTSVEYANAGIPGQGGLYLGKALTLAPLKSFSLDVRWAAAVTLTANVYLRVSLWGTHYYEIT